MRPRPRTALTRMAGQEAQGEPLQRFVVTSKTHERRRSLHAPEHKRNARPGATGRNNSGAVNVMGRGGGEGDASREGSAHMKYGLGLELLR